MAEHNANADDLLDRDSRDLRRLWSGPSRLSEKLFDLPDLRGGRHLDGLRFDDGLQNDSGAQEGAGDVKMLPRPPPKGIGLAYHNSAS